MLIYLLSINKNISITTLFKTLIQRQNISLELDSIFKTIMVVIRGATVYI